MNTRKLIVVLGDQLSSDLAALQTGDPKRDVVVMAEVTEEVTYVPHHKKKLVFVFSAMRHFAEDLRQAGWHVEYTELDEPENTGSVTGEVKRSVDRYRPEEVVITEAGEWRLQSSICAWGKELGKPVSILPDSRFVASHAEFRDWAEGRKQLRMEFFCREMRRKTGLLMSGDAPEGGKWNFDAENRKPIKGEIVVPEPLKARPDSITENVLAMVDVRFRDNFGTLRPFYYAVTRTQALAALEHFINCSLASFGDYQDAMRRDEPFLFHSVLAQYLNIGLLNLLEICRRVERAYYEGQVPLNAAEGYIRQIIGWREFIRGVYWLNMPAYTAENYFEARRALPQFYWTAETAMACVKAAVEQTRDEAYAHHIQRLMVTGNFAMLAGVDPFELHTWYLTVYADAYEWVEAPNVIGMSQFADGGLLGSKPYAASGNYINKMSDYCRGCRYDVKKRSGDDACPFNPLYWDFLVRNEDRLRTNPRLAQIYRTWDRFDETRKLEVRRSAQSILARLEEI